MSIVEREITVKDLKKDMDHASSISERLEILKTLHRNEIGGFLKVYRW